MRARLLPAVLAVALVGVGCGGDDGGDGAAGAPSTATPADTGSTPREGPGPGILAFEASDVDGATVDVSALAGTDLAIWFWAPW